MTRAVMWMLLFQVIGLVLVVVSEQKGGDDQLMMAARVLTLVAAIGFGVAVAQAYTISIPTKLFLFLLGFGGYIVLWCLLLSIKDYLKTGNFTFLKADLPGTSPGCTLLTPDALQRDYDFMRYRTASDRKTEFSFFRKLVSRYHPDNCIKEGCESECTESFKKILENK